MSNWTHTLERKAREYERTHSKTLDEIKKNICVEHRVSFWRKVQQIIAENYRIPNPVE